jgi:hypothetical protein
VLKRVGNLASVAVRPVSAYRDLITEEVGLRGASQGLLSLEPSRVAPHYGPHSHKIYEA